MMPQAPVTYVIAGNYQQYTDWLRQQDPCDHSRFKYLGTPESVLGLHDVRIVLVGRYWESPAYAEADQRGLLRARIERVISGGQTGADQAGLAAAVAAKIPTGGWAPRGYVTEAGSNLSLASAYKLMEHQGGYGPRTDANVQLADGTIRFASYWSSPGERRTYRAIQRFGKPYIDVDVNGPRAVEEVVRWIRLHQIRTLNVAGNSQSRSPGIYQFVFDYLLRVFRETQRTNTTGWTGSG